MIKLTKTKEAEISLGLLIFLAISLITILSSVWVIKSREIFHAALFLALMLAGVAGLFVLLNAAFLAAIQVLIYIGGIAVLILFAIMLTKREER